MILLTLWLYPSGAALLVGAQITAVIARTSAPWSDPRARPPQAGA